MKQIKSLKLHSQKPQRDSMQIELTYGCVANAFGRNWQWKQIHGRFIVGHRYKKRYKWFQLKFRFSRIGSKSSEM